MANVVARLAAFNITWAGFPAYESVPHGRAILKDTGALLKKLDPYQHPRMTMAEVTSAPLLADGWSNMLGYGTHGCEHRRRGASVLSSARARHRHQEHSRSVERDHERPVSGGRIGRIHDGVVRVHGRQPLLGTGAVFRRRWRAGARARRR